MRAAKHFLLELKSRQNLAAVDSISCELYGSLAYTGTGHGTDKAIILGLMGEAPDEIEPDDIEQKLALVSQSLKIVLGREHPIPFDPRKHIIALRRKNLPLHANGLRFVARSEERGELHAKVYYSIGGGLITDESMNRLDGQEDKGLTLPYPFTTASDLLRISSQHGLSLAEIMMANELSWRSLGDVESGLDLIWDVMKSCMERGCQASGVLPGRLQLERRAPELYAELVRHQLRDLNDPLTVMDWVNLYALAVSEENAAGSRVVTAPTNGAAGIIPATLRYYDDFCPGADRDGIRRFLLTAGAIGLLYTKNASISGAEVGCQGEVGVACSMAAGGLAAALGGGAVQIEEAAEIGMEHNLGLTCDPIGGLVQIPCIERNAMGAVKAINACRLAMKRVGSHHVSLDAVIRTMRATGADMKSKYKETSRGGLAVNVPEC